MLGSFVRNRRRVAVAPLYAAVGAAVLAFAAAGPATAQDVTTATEEFALNATLTADETEVTATETIHYHLTIENIGNRPVTGIHATVADCASPVADLAPGEEVTVDCELETDETHVGSVAHTATVTSNEAPDAASNEVTTTVIEPDRGVAGADQPAEPSITIAQTADQTSVFASQAVDLHLTLENTGNITLTGIVIVDVEAPDCAGPVPDLAAGATTTIDCSYTTVLADGGTWRNTAAVETDQTPLLESNEIQVTVTVPTCGNEPVNVSLAEGHVPTEGNDVILGTDGADVVDGLGGADFICALGGDDVLTGGSGNDVLVGMDGADTINGGSGADVLLGDLDFASPAPGADVITGGGGNDYIDAGARADQIDAGPGNDTILGKGGADEIDGGTGRDVILAEGGLDVVSGGGDDDFIRGGAEGDVLDGGGGRDTVFGGSGDDTLRGGAGRDNLDGGEGKDILEGGTERDSLFGRAGADTISGGDGDDHMEGGDGADAVNGDSGNDVALGGTANDTIHGNDGNDVIFGDANDDRLFGDAGIDRVNGGSGNDRLSGGAGRDGCFGDAGTDTADNSCEARQNIP